MISMLMLTPPVRQMADPLIEGLRRSPFAWAYFLTSAAPAAVVAVAPVSYTHLTLPTILLV